MRTSGIIVADPLLQSGMQAEAGFKCMPINAFIFQRAPQPFNEDIVHPPALAIHADADARRDQHLRERQTCELGGFNRPSQQLIG